MIRTPRLRATLIAATALVASLLTVPSSAQAGTVVTVPGSLRGIAIDPTGTYAYAIDNTNGDLERITLADNTTQAVLSGLNGPRSVAVTTDGALIVVGGTDRIYLVDPANPTTDDSFITNAVVDAVAVAPDAAYAATLQGGRTYRLVRGGGGWPSAASWTIVWNGAAGVAPRGLAADDSVLLIGNEGGLMRRVLDPAACTAPCTGNTVPGTDSGNSRGIAIDPTGAFAYFGLNATGAFRRLDLTTDAITTISGSTGSAARQVAFTPDGAYSYSVFEFSHTVQKIRTSDNTVISTVTMPGNPLPMSLSTSPVSGSDQVVVAGTAGNVYRYPAAPDAPTSLSAAFGDESAVISFTAGNDQLSQIVNYEYSLDGTTWAALSPADASSPVTITGLPNGVTQSIRLRAVNGAGPGDPSTSVSVTPKRVPDAPTITGADWDDTTASILFSAPVSDGGDTITDYEYSLDSGATWTARVDAGGAASPLVISGLTPGTTYTVDLRAVNSVGGGAMTATPISVTPGTPRTPPSPPPTFPARAPRDVTGSVVGRDSAVVTWDEPDDSGSFPVSTYQVTAAPGGATCLSVTTSCAVSGLTNGVLYTFRVRALNGSGWSDYSASSAPLDWPTSLSVLISGGRKGRGVVWISGLASGPWAGEARPHIAIDGRRKAVIGRPVALGSDGSFAWQRRIARGASIAFELDGEMSNAVRVKPWRTSTRR